MPLATAIDATLPLPEIPGYRLLCVIAHGGMAIVYRGTQLSLGRDVAIKVMRAEALADEVSRRRFENEARTIARLEHPHIVSIHEVGRTGDGLPWYSMPYLPHGHLGQRASARHVADTDDAMPVAPAVPGLPPGAMPEARVREILRALLSALGYAHVRGVIHRDVKAENVLFDEADRPLLTDFGIALRRGYGTRVTMAGLAVGSTAYMAPEQARGQQVDKRADLYSVGVLAWEMLSGALPYQADDALAMAIMHTQNPIPRLPPRLRHWQRFMDRALAKEPGRRFADAAEMLEAVERVPAAGSPTSAMTRMLQTFATGAGRPARMMLICTLLLAVAGTAVWLGASRDAPDAPPPPAIAAASAAGSADAPGSAGDGSGVEDTDTVATLADDTEAASGDEVPTPDPPGLSRAPISASDRHIAAAERQIRAGRLTAPAGESALDELLAAWQADQEHLRVPPTAERLFDAVGRRAARRIERGDDADAVALLSQVRRQAAPLDGKGFDPMRPIRPHVADAVERRIEKAIAAVDRDDAVAALAAADAVGLDASDTARLRRAAMTIPQLDAAGEHAPAGLRVTRGDAGVFAIARAPVSRAEYERFASATGRKAAPCGRASLRRARSWEAPGFEQAPGDPVVCVSWHDAIDYARWISERTGRSVVVASMAQGATQPPAAGAPAEWRSDCPSACRQRVAVDGDAATRELDPARGYDDVGFRLVRLP
ncbi:protein kinase [Luteimonas sp. BDR2-5]|uniref:bifunctional serine/threonine-protein kinase/formylglycine-generating enzyme family protein n=1 Tax=Proluteimonas luteida TaxID=2878685 RepID=UPI001E518D5C|nr:bifunctional serine/threonine-protein kinase/formylglycine-generating enzyme family protein [Luteimonas sp. BDR2-5]MCD9028078.1 protein kinase [Luteimonas sp. BDR2-5]